MISYCSLLICFPFFNYFFYFTFSIYKYKIHTKRIPTTHQFTCIIKPSWCSVWFHGIVIVRMYRFCILKWAGYSTLEREYLSVGAGEPSSRTCECRVGFMSVIWQVEESFVLFSACTSFFKSQCTFSAAPFSHADFRHWSPVILHYETLNSRCRFNLLYKRNCDHGCLCWFQLVYFSLKESRWGAWI